MLVQYRCLEVKCEIELYKRIFFLLYFSAFLYTKLMNQSLKMGEIVKPNKTIEIKPDKIIDIAQNCKSNFL